MHWKQLKNKRTLMDYNANECSLKILDIKNSLVLCSYYAYHILIFLVFFLNVVFLK